MNVKELMISQPPAAIAALLLDKVHAKPDDRGRGMKRLMKFIEGLNQIEPVDSRHLQHILAIQLIRVNPQRQRRNSSCGSRTSRRISAPFVCWPYYPT